MWVIDLVKSGDVEMVVMVDFLLKHLQLAVIFVYVGSRACTDEVK